MHVRIFSLMILAIYLVCWSPYDPTSSRWDNARAFIKFLKIFYEVSKVFSSEYTYSFPLIFFYKQFSIN